MSRSFTLVSLSLAAATTLAGCAQSGLDLTTGSSFLAPQTVAKDAKPARVNTSALAARYQGDPKNAEAARAYVLALRQTGETERALEIADKALKVNAKDAELRRLHAMLSLEQGKVAYAEKALAKEKSRDWRTHSALGVAYASRGRQKDAQAEFAKALKLSPNEPSVLNNLALSYAIEGKREKAETILRKLATTKGIDPRVQQNLALVIGVGGQIEESARISRAVMPNDAARANARYLSDLTGSGPGKRADAGNSSSSQLKVTRRVGADPTTPTKTAKASFFDAPTYQLGGPRETK